MFYAQYFSIECKIGIFFNMLNLVVEQVLLIISITTFNANYSMHPYFYLNENKTDTAK